MKARSNDLVSSTSSIFGLRIVAGLRIRLASIMYFFLLLLASLLMLWYVGCMSGMAGEILIGFDFLTFLTFGTLRELLR